MNDVEFTIQVGRKIKSLRTSQNISQAQLAFEAEIPREQIGRIENGKINTTIRTLFLIAKALNVPVSELVTTDKEYINLD